MFLKKLVGKRDIENALQRLENMTLEETRMTAAETLKAIHGIGNKVGDKMHGVQDALQAVQEKVGGFEGMLRGVTDMFVITSAQTVPLLKYNALIVYMVRR